ncbi:MAG: hypothetical protein RR619_09105, partial [Raoultibacter sp.]
MSGNRRLRAICKTLVDSVKKYTKPAENLLGLIYRLMPQLYRLACAQIWVEMRGGKGQLNPVTASS